MLRDVLPSYTKLVESVSVTVRPPQKLEIVIENFLCISEWLMGMQGWEASLFLILERFDFVAPSGEVQQAGEVEYHQ